MSLLALAAVGARAQMDSPFGVHSHVTRGDEYPFLQDEMDLMRQAGIGWLRTGFVWSSIEPKPGEWDFARCDDVVDSADAHGVRIMGLLHGAPGWAEPIIEHLDEWREFVRTTLTRYKGRVPAWQVWNEPNLEQFWKNPDPIHYGKLLNTTYDVIKECDPDALVIWGATSGLDWQFIEAALPVVAGNYDRMAIHPYGYGDPQAPEAYIYDAVHELATLQSRFGEAKPVWFTEWGWPTHTGRRSISDRQQGQCIARAYILAVHAGLERGFWYEFQERSKSDEVNEDAFGMLEYDLKPKPAYQAYSVLIKARPAGSKECEGPWRRGLTYFPAWERPDGVTVHAVWDIWGRWQKPRMAPAHFDGPLIEAFDYLGKPIELDVDGSGNTIIPLDEGSPMYIVGPKHIDFK